MIKEIILSSQINNTCKSVYLFGSAYTSLTPSDIDIIYIYKETYFCYEHAIYFRKTISQKITEMFNIPADIVLLSETEEIELNYLQNVNSFKLW